jgi:hypothetical protein
MKTAIDRTPADKAAKHLMLFMIWGAVLSGIGLFIVPALGIAGLAFSARALLLTYHPSNLKDPHLSRKRALNIFAIVAGAVDVIFLLV